MTAIVAYTNGSKVWIAGDHFVGNDSKKDLCKTSKVYKIGNLGVGFCGYHRQGLILESVLKNVDPKIFSDKWILFTLPDLLFDTMQTKGALINEEGQFTLGDSCYILAFNGLIYYLESDFGVWKTKKNVAAIGTGQEYALGALSALGDKNIKKYPKKCLIKALKIAAMWSPWVTPPFNTIEIE
jgi:ATP-dependent protease HslVU (ClpYQ) peptidase subunit